DVRANSQHVAAHRRYLPPGVGTSAAMLEVATRSLPWGMWNVKRGTTRGTERAAAAERYGNFQLGANLAAAGAPRSLALRAGGLVNIIEAIAGASMDGYSTAVAGLVGLGPHGSTLGDDSKLDFGDVRD